MKRHFPAITRCLALLCVVLACTPAAAQTPIPSAAGLNWQKLTSVDANLIAIRHAGDGSGRLFLVRQTGEISIYDGDRLLSPPFLDITDKVSSRGQERGLLGLAFHPDYADNGLFYVSYTRDDAPGSSVIERYRVAQNDGNRADPGSAQTVIEIEQDFSNHNGGNIDFGPDGYLYFGTGDGGSGGDPRRRAQDLRSLLGKMLRLDVDRVTPADRQDTLCGISPNYAIPADNPFTGIEPLFANGFETGTAAASASGCPEIWAYGLRNPWRWSFADNGDMFIGDVGQDQAEEISLLPAGRGGLNFGWRCFEADRRYAGSVDPACIAPRPIAPVAPILSYPHDAGLGRSVTGGYRYRGSIAALRGVYLYGDYLSGQIWFATPDGTGGWQSAPRMATGFLIASFGEDANGELYLADYSTGDVYRLIAQ